MSAVRIVSWNTANAPNNSVEDAYFSTVFEAIGNENVAGNAMAPGIIALQETDTAVLGGNSILRIENLLETLYPQSNYAHSATPLDTGDDAIGFVYDTDLFSLVSTHIVDETPGMQAFAHNIYRGQFRPVATSGDQDFYIYSTHLKAGSSDSDAARRTAEANAIRVDIDALGDGQEVLVMGDFNIGGSSEGAYQNFLSSGNGQLFDPIDSPGEWKNNFAFRGIHTQNPAINGPGGMDDRFDFQLVTSEVLDDENLQFIEGSYRAFGNNNTHTFNSDITTGTGASPTVLAALAAASDHLPVVADYQLGARQPGITISLTDGTNQVSEGGASDTYSIVLNSVPTSDVTVTITTDGETTVSGATTTSIVFTPGDALTPKTLMIDAVDDDDDEGAHQSLITHAISSADSDYSTLSDQTVPVTVNDNDSPNGGGGQIVISEIMYNSNTSEPNGEWVEVVNLGPGGVDLSGWKLDDEDSTDWGAIPAGSPTLAAGEVAVLHNNAISSSDFRTSWNVPASAKVIGVTWGSLANSPSSSSEILELLDSEDVVQDTVNYDDTGDWPADDNASSIYLTDLATDNNLGLNWALSVVGQGDAINPTGSTFSSDDVGSPGNAPVQLANPPQVVEVRFDQNGPGDDQRSLVRSVTLVFDEEVQAGENAFELIARGSVDPGVDVNLKLVTVDDQSEATLTFEGNHVDAISGSLLDGNYQLTINSALVTSVASGLSLDGNSDGAAGGNYLLGDEAADNFFRLFGDSDGDRDVDGLDLGAFGQAFLKTSGVQGYQEILDYDTDGDIDGLDLGAFGQRFLDTVPFS